MSALRLSVPGQPPRLVIDPTPHLTSRQRQVLEVTRSYNGNRSRAARQLGIRVQSVQASLRLCHAAGERIPKAPNCGAGRGPDLTPRRGR